MGKVEKYLALIGLQLGGLGLMIAGIVLNGFFMIAFLVGLLAVVSAAWVMIADYLVNR